MAVDLLLGRSTFGKIYVRGDLLSKRIFSLFPSIYFGEIYVLGGEGFRTVPVDLVFGKCTFGERCVQKGAYILFRRAPSSGLFFEGNAFENKNHKCIWVAAVLGRGRTVRGPQRVWVASRGRGPRFAVGGRGGGPHGLPGAQGVGPGAWGGGPRSAARKWEAGRKGGGGAAFGPRAAWWCQGGAVCGPAREWGGGRATDDGACIMHSSRVHPTISTDIHRCIYQDFPRHFFEIVDLRNSFRFLSLDLPRRSVPSSGPFQNFIPCSVSKDGAIVLNKFIRFNHLFGMFYQFQASTRSESESAGRTGFQC